MYLCYNLSVDNTRFIRNVVIFGFTFFLVSLITLPFLAPILSHFGFKKTSNIIYGIYSFMCHQKAHRSLFIFDEQCAWCARDTFIWTAVLLGWIFVLQGKHIEGISWKVALLFALPMALDGTIQLIATITSLYTGSEPFYESTNTIRAITGSLFGIAISTFFFPRLNKELSSN